jgi:pyrroloquinoline-quinone synthase
MTHTESTIHAMQAAIARHDLLAHPFYQAWSAGTLPVDALTTYAREYGAFIATLEHGWATLGEPDGAAIERHHVALWSGFAGALGTSIADAASIPEVRALADEATRSFATPAEAAGALYAFERQQPATAQSKLDGLDRHYTAIADGARPYFDAHACETGEDTLLEAKLAGMTDAERVRAGAACDRMAHALWNALSGIHAGAC